MPYICFEKAFLLWKEFTLLIYITDDKSFAHIPHSTCIWLMFFFSQLFHFSEFVSLIVVINTNLILSEVYFAYIYISLLCIYIYALIEFFKLSTCNTGISLSFSESVWLWCHAIKYLEHLYVIIIYVLLFVNISHMVINTTFSSIGSCRIPTAGFDGSWKSVFIHVHE